jgi:hypothetical protein
VFSEEPLGEIRGILLYLVLPVAIGAIISFMWSYCWNRRSKTETREMPRFAASVLCGTILCWLGYVFSFVDQDVNNWGDSHFSISAFAFCGIFYWTCALDRRAGVAPRHLYEEQPNQIA